MKIRAAGRSAIARRLAVGAVSVGVVSVAAVAALIGPAAGAAQAMEASPVSCAALHEAALSAWDNSDEWNFEAEKAFYSGDVVTWAIDRNNEQASIDEGDRFYDEYTNAGC
jgi:flagellar basal body L-ring protein FlgH